jgi:hypothetical protein
LIADGGEIICSLSQYRRSALGGVTRPGGNPLTAGLRSRFTRRAVPETQAGTAQARYASVTSGLAMGGAMLVIGPLYAAYAGRAYWAMAAMGLVAFAASLVLVRAKPRAVLLG